MATGPIWVTVFADPAATGGGNPCPVVFEADDLSTDQMQAMARSFGVETVFVSAPSVAADARLRFFVPLRELSMCVHASLAAGLLLVATGRSAANPLSVQTELGVLPVEVDLASGRAVLEQFRPVFGPPVGELSAVLAALRLPAEALDISVGPVCSASTSRPKLMIPLRDEAVLDGLSPDFDQLWNACDELEVTGFYPFAVERRSIMARQFPARSGYPEDPATGLAACALGAYLAVFGRPDDGMGPGWQRRQISQGRAMGRPSVMTAETLVEADGTVLATRVAGTVTVTG